MWKGLKNVLRHSNFYFAQSCFASIIWLVHFHWRDKARKKGPPYSFYCQTKHSYSWNLWYLLCQDISSFQFFPNIKIQLSLTTKRAFFVFWTDMGKLIFGKLKKMFVEGFESTWKYRKINVSFLPTRGNHQGVDVTWESPWE